MGVASKRNEEAAGYTVDAVSVSDSLLRDTSHDEACPFDMLPASFRANCRSRAVRAESDVLGKDLGSDGEDDFLVRFCNRLNCCECPGQTLGEKFGDVALPLNS